MRKIEWGQWMIGKVATANRLREGDIVYLTKERDWSPNLQDAWIVVGDDSELSRCASEAEKRRDVVAAYLIEVKRVGNELFALSQRERIRAAGPTV